METLLLTGTIAPSKWVLGQGDKTEYTMQSNVRYQRYISALLYYISASNFGYICFCENSNFAFPEKDKEALISIASLFWKQIELLSFQWNTNNTEKYNYWYWEAEIIDYAFENSHFLKQTSCRYKITWRYIYRDIDKILEELKEEQVYIHNGLHYSEFFSVTTAFFKMSNTFYEKHLHKKTTERFVNCRGKENAIEHIRYYLLRKTIKDLTIKKLSFIPYATIHKKRINFFLRIKKFLGIFEFWSIQNIFDKILFKYTVLGKKMSNKKTFNS